MGTRHLICVVKDGEYKVAQYGQWDGYPEGQGVGVLDFLSNQMERSLFEKKLTEVSELAEEEYKQRWLDLGIDITTNDGYVDYRDAMRFDKLYPEISRDTGSNILSLIQNSDKPLKLHYSINFAKNSLFCEWAYVIDLDKNTFEVFEGFNCDPLTPDERFYSEGEFKDYYPVKNIKTFLLDNLPTKEEFLAYFNNEEEETAP